MKNKVVIIEDDYEFAKMQAEMINKLENFECTAIFTSPSSFLQNNNFTKKEDIIILLDIVMPEMNGLDAIPLILNKIPDASIIMNSIMDDTDYILRAIQEGAVGYLDKQNFIPYVEIVLDSVVSHGAYMTPKIARKIFGHFHGKKKNIDILTPREKDVAKGIIEGLSYKLIASDLNISIDTVRMNIRSIYRKFKINSKPELIRIIGELSNPRIN